ncbi:MAG: C10 family peptidase [Bacteroidaceae bacterium]|nr:C10 family peptidase [Bacteroidaceae bacterium]
MFIIGLIMNVQNLTKQTAMIFLCGLLPLFSFAQQRNKEKALCIAEKFFKSNTLVAPHSPKYRLCATSFSLSALKKEKGNGEAYYIYTDSLDNKGFVIVSGDERMPEVLGYSNTSFLDVMNIPPALQYLLDCYAEEYSNFQTSSIPSFAKLRDVRIEGVEPLLGNVRWDQTTPYWNHCPIVEGERCYTGCVATAMAQVMKYHQFPNQGRGKKSYLSTEHNLHISHDFSKDYFKWDSMLDGYNGHYTTEQADAVATLMYSCGVSVEMNYGIAADAGSGTSQENLLYGYIENFGYDPDACFFSRGYCNTEDWHQVLITELNEGRPVNYAGKRPSETFGHSFVLDGYKLGNAAYPYYHVNFGWSGSGDGYFQLANIKYTEGQEMTVGIKPDDGVDERRSCLGTNKLQLSQNVIGKGKKLMLYSDVCSNISYRKFQGEVRIVLVDAEDNEWPLESQDFDELAYLDKKRNFSITSKLPENLPSGRYYVGLESKQNLSDKWCGVYSPNILTLTVSDVDTIVPVMEGWASLGCSELELVDSEDKSLICMNIYELQNLKERAFIGDLRMALATNKGDLLFLFGDSIQPDELGFGDIPIKTYSLSGRISKSLSDGLYRLYVAARDITTTEYSYVLYRNWATSYMEPEELFFDVRISNGKAYVNNHVYDLQPMNEVVNINAITDLIDKYLSGDSSVLLDDIVKLIDKYLSQE